MPFSTTPVSSTWPELDQAGVGVDELTSQLQAQGQVQGRDQVHTEDRDSNHDGYQRDGHACEVVGEPLDGTVIEDAVSQNESALALRTILIS